MKGRPQRARWFGMASRRVQVTNQAKFFGGPGTPALANGHFLNGTHIMRARDRAHDRRIVLVVDHYVPEPGPRPPGPRHHAHVHPAPLIGAGVVVEVLAISIHTETPGYTQVLQDMGVEVMYGTASMWATPSMAQGQWARIWTFVLLSRPGCRGALSAE